MECPERISVPHPSQRPQPSQISRCVLLVPQTSRCPHHMLCRFSLPLSLFGILAPLSAGISALTHTEAASICDILRGAVSQLGVAEVVCWVAAVVGASHEMRVYNESTLLSTTALKDHPSGLVPARSAPPMQ